MYRALLVPGLGLDARAWQPTIDALHRLGRYDATVAPLPAYGVRASRHRGLGPDELSTGLDGLLADRGGGWVLCGHSASCQVVAHAAARRPEGVAALVLVGPTTDPRASGWSALVGRWLATARHESPTQVPDLVRQYSRTGPVSMLRAMNAARRDPIQDALRLLTCPVLVVRGGHDRIAPPDWARTLTREAPATGASSRRTATVAAGGHMVPLTHGNLTAEAIHAFLQDAVPVVG